MWEIFPLFTLQGVVKHFCGSRRNFSNICLVKWQFFSPCFYCVSVFVDYCCHVSALRFSHITHQAVTTVWVAPQCHFLEYSCSGEVWLSISDAVFSRGCYRFMLKSHLFVCLFMNRKSFVVPEETRKQRPGAKFLK